MEDIVRTIKGRRRDKARAQEDNARLRSAQQDVLRKLRTPVPIPIPPPSPPSSPAVASSSSSSSFSSSFSLSFSFSPLLFSFPTRFCLRLYLSESESLQLRVQLVGGEGLRFC